MASSPPPPSPTSTATASEPSHFKPPSSLPVMALRDKIVEKVAENRVTLIIGDTGCGKSSQVPQFLLDENECPILCTQPRRFAVVAIARTVADARNCELGGEVGFHIGHSKLVTSRSKLIFKTAGVLLDEMLDKGIDALKYKVIILDEVHERSVESDLVLACVKQFMIRNHNLRLVLMSATADITRYRDYFKDLGRGERVEVLAIPSSSQQAIFQRRVLYLEQIAELLEKDIESVETPYQSAVNPFSVDATIKPDILIYIRDLVLHIHENEHDIEKSILVFLPTYMSLEQQWSLLQPHSLSFQIHILHSSIDIQKALMAMKISRHARKVILATNIAESSVTIPGVAYVIDSCRSLQVFWDSIGKRETSELTWISKSQADQRKGRTGRTCDGEVYRLVTQTFYNNLSDHEQPTILRLSLRQQVLAICSAESKAINDPKVLMQKALDPPNQDVVEDALNLLVSIHALEKPVSHRGRYEPTFYGRLLASLRLSFDASILALKLGSMGHLREGILLGVLADVNPLPIIQPFGDNVAFAENIGNYFDQGTNQSTLPIGKKEVISMANLCAFQFWQRVFKDKHRLEQLKQTLNKNVEPTTRHSVIFKMEEEWCLVHNLVQTSLHQISDMYDDALDALHRFRPNFLAGPHEPPSCYEPYNFNHVCLFQEELACFLDRETKCQCFSVPYIYSSDFKANDFAEKLVAAVKQMRMQQIEQDVKPQHVDNGVPSVIDERSLCKFFASGSCLRGSECYFSHSLQAKKPMCKFFFSLQGCRNGDSCFFSHSEEPSALSFSSPLFCSSEGEDVSINLSQYLPNGNNISFLVVDDDPPCSFSASLSCHCGSAKIISTTSQPCLPDFEPPENVTVLWRHSDLSQLIVGREGMKTIPWDNVKCVLWFVKFSTYEENVEALQLRVQSFFEHISIKLLADTLYDVQVILTMNNIRYAQLKVEKIARDCFFYLAKSFIFDESTFGNLDDQYSKKRMQISRPVSYIFDMHPPSDIQFGDYSTALHKSLNLNL